MNACLRHAVDGRWRELGAPRRLIVDYTESGRAPQSISIWATRAGRCCCRRA